ncbi:uncharacterized protein LOC107367151 [Tetranychus urticae]|uniref:Decapping nuclease n=1 Tax=Tetranychus urticae TaxID=32264 RepID=T1KUC7_TETUR|nr:uncharacterized protein LOC107367151 [Tetranychus urticae]
MLTIKQLNNSATKHELNLKKVESSWISLKGPKRLGCFSSYYNEENVKIYCPDKSLLAYLDIPEPLFIDCLQGYDPNVKYGHQSIGNIHLLRWVMDNEATLEDYPSDFVCYNGLLKDMMMSRYIKDHWDFFAIKIKGKIIMLRIDSKKKQDYIDEQSAWNNKSTYVALNLRRLITKTDNGHESNLVKEGESCHGIFHSKIGCHRILHAGWLDCVESKEELTKPFDQIKFGSIKKIQNHHETISFNAGNTWWSLATLSGVETITCARCEYDFTVDHIDKLSVSNLIPRERQMEFFTSLNLMLDYIKSIVTEDNQYYDFYFNGTVKTLTGCERMNSNEKIIPSWYVDGQLPHVS